MSTFRKHSPYSVRYGRTVQLYPDTVLVMVLVTNCRTVLSWSVAQCRHYLL